MKGNLGILIYSTVLGVVCAALLTGAAKLTEPYRLVNAKAEETRHILSVLGVPFDEKVSASDLQKIIEKNVRETTHGGVKMFEYVPADGGGKVVGAAVPFAGQGVWGPIKGFLALESDLKTIRGIAFSEQEETPGLGGEIVADWFRNQFNGKSIVDAAGRPGIHIGGPATPSANRVDAISGATMTSQKVEGMLNETIRKLTEKQDKHGN